MTKRLLVALAIALSATAQQTPTPAFTEPTVYVTAIDLVTEVKDRSGKVPLDLTPADFNVLEDGKPMPIIGVEYLRATVPAPAPATAKTAAAAPAAAAPVQADPDWQVVVYFDCVLTGETSRRNAAQSIAKRAEELARLGTVEIVVADPLPAAVLEASRDVNAIRKALLEVPKRHGRPNWLLRHRRQFLVDRDLASGQVSTAIATFVKPYILAEIEMTNRFRRTITEWISRYPRHSPRALMLVSDGFELDPVQFYTDTVGNLNSLMQMQREAAEFQGDAGNDRLAQLLAGAGWMTIGVPGTTGGGDSWTDDASRSGTGRTRDLLRGNPNQTNAPTFLITHARQPLQHYADATGGTVLASASQIDRAVTALGQRVKVTYQVARPPDGRVRKVEIRANRPGLQVRTTQWASSTTPEEVASARVAGLLRGHKEIGDLPTKARLEWVGDHGGKRDGLLFVKVGLDDIEPLLKSSTPAFRVTIGVKGGGEQPFAVHRTSDRWDRTAMEFAWSGPITAPRSNISIAVTVEELTSGAWGATVIETK